MKLYWYLNVDIDIERKYVETDIVMYLGLLKSIDRMVFTDCIDNSVNMWWAYVNIHIHMTVSRSQLYLYMNLLYKRLVLLRYFVILIYVGLLTAIFLQTEFFQKKYLTF